MSNNLVPLAPSRWNVEKARVQHTESLASFHNDTVERYSLLKESINKKALALYEKILQRVRWAIPEFPPPFRNAVVEYCEYLLSSESNTAASKNKIAFYTWYDTCDGTDMEKVAIEIKELCDKLQSLVSRREKMLSSMKIEFFHKSEKMAVHGESQLKWLSEKNFSIRDKFWTVWYFAGQGLIASLQRLVDSEPSLDINQPDQDFGYTALHYASKKNRLEVVKYLIEKGAYVDVPSVAESRTPLHLAAQYADKEVVGELLACGANINARDCYGLRPIELAEQNKNSGALAYLQRWVSGLDAISSIAPHVMDERESSLLPPVVRASVLMGHSSVSKARMSSSLALLTERLLKLEESDRVAIANSDRGGASLFAEIRLCERHASLCFQEEFIHEGTISLQRRWMLSLRLLQQQIGDSASGSSGPSSPPQPVAVAAAGLEYAERLLKNGRLENALEVLSECAAVSGLGKCSVLLTIAVRACEVALGLYDRATSDFRRSEPAASLSHLTDIGAQQSDAYKMTVSIPAEKKHQLLIQAERYANLALTVFHELPAVNFAMTAPVMLLELLADVFVRKGEVSEVKATLELAEIACCELFGPDHEESVRVAVRVVFATLKHFKRVEEDGGGSQIEAYMAAGKRAAHLSSVVERMPENLNQESRWALARQCAEVLALATLLQESGGKSVRRGGEAKGKNSLRTTAQAMTIVPCEGAFRRLNLITDCNPLRSDFVQKLFNR